MIKQYHTKILLAMKVQRSYLPIITATIAIVLSFIPNRAMASSTGGILGNIDAQSILENISTLLLPITQLVLAVSFVAGIAFMFKGVAMLHSFGQIQHQMSKPHGITGPFIYMGIGAALLYLPSTVVTASNTIFGSSFTDFFTPADTINFTGIDDASMSVSNIPNYEQNASNKLMAYYDIGGGQEWASLIDVVVKFIQLIGLIAFIRGWFILSHSAEGNSQQGGLSKGLTHIIGGILSINFIPFMQALSQLI